MSVNSQNPDSEPDRTPKPFKTMHDGFWILRLLHASETDTTNTSLPTKTHLHIGLYLTNHHLHKQSLVSNTTLSFTRTRYGPQTDGLDDAISALENNNLLSVSTSDNKTRYALTNAGQTVANDAFNELNTDIQHILQRISNDHLNKDLSRLLPETYTHHSNMFLREQR